MNRRPMSASVVVLLILGSVSIPALPAGGKSHTATITVTIERVTALSCLEISTSGSGESGPQSCSTPADFYSVIRIGEASSNFRSRTESLTLANRNDVSPNWKFGREVNWSLGTMPVVIEIWDRDADGDDDRVDLTPSTGRDLRLGVDLAPCYVSGDVGGASFPRGGCDVTLTSAGRSTDRARIEFRLRVDPYNVGPPVPAGGRVRCTHSPVWPQPGQAVTITAESLTSTLQPLPVERIEIWTSVLGPSATGEGSTLTYTRTYSTTLTYLCRTVGESINAISSARNVWVGAAPASGSVPILTTGRRDRGIDITFIADTDDYTSAGDPQFITDVGNVIRNGYFGEDIYLRNDRNGGGFNFYILTTMGDADPPAPGNLCPQISFPRTSWAESQMLVHRNVLRDCAWSFGFTGSPNRPRVVLHESGHRPFGLADEYCCDGGYRQPVPFPDVFADRNPDPEDCEADAIAVGRSLTACRTWTSSRDGQDWFTHDPASNDLMVDNATLQLLDIRRISWVLQSCRYRNACAGG